MLDRGAIERGLESGRFSGPVATLASQAWAAVATRRVARPLRVPSHARIIAVGGATLGGSWKTPLAVACAARVAEEGIQVTLVGHAYRAEPGRARFVEPGDPPREVGDEALACIRELAPRGAGGERSRVVVAPTRQEALDLALHHADHVVLDGALQLAPRRAALSLLVVDARAPWGAAACPPRGDLRAPVSALVSACDRIVAVGGADEACPSLAGLDRPVDRARAVLRGARLGSGSGEMLSLAELGRARLGLWTSIGRPSRVVDALAREGVFPRTVLSGPDHGPVSARARAAARDAGVDVWLCTPKCSVHVGDELEGRPVYVLDTYIDLGASLAEAIVAATTATAPGCPVP